MGLMQETSGNHFFEYSPDEVFAALSVVLGSNPRYKIKESNSTSRIITVKTGMSLKSWGEDLIISVCPTDRRMATISISSKSKFGVADWGKNQENLQEIANGVCMELQKENYHKLAHDDATEIPNSIKKLFELRESGILTDEEFQQKKAALLERL